MDVTLTILIVDDSMTARRWTSGALADLCPDWEILEAESADDALAKVENRAIDGILVDLNMPGIDGFVLAEKLARLFPDAPLALLTANIQRRTQEKADEHGYQFIAKPVTAQKLEAFVARLGP